jgi:hypothetical protein
LFNPKEKNGNLPRGSSGVLTDYDGCLLIAAPQLQKGVFCLLNVEFSGHVWEKMVEREVMDSNFLAF